jgi:hypothetical protein
MVRVKKRFNALYSLADIGKRNSKGLFLYKRLPEKKIEHTNNAAEIIFSLVVIFREKF